MRTNEAPVAAIAVEERRRLEPARGELRPKPELLEDTRPVRRQGDRGTDFAQFGSLLVDVDGDAVLAQRDRQCQPADAGTDDCDATSFHWEPIVCS